MTKRRWEKAFEGKKAGFMKYEDHMYRNIANLIPDGSTILDAACGVAYLSEFVDRGLYTGIDITDDLLCIAKTRYSDIVLLHRNVLDTGFEDNSYDYVVAKDIFEHMHPDEVPQAIKELIRVARKGLIISFFKAPSHRTHVKTGSDGHFSNRYEKHKVLSWVLAAAPNSVINIKTVERMQEIWEIAL